MLAGIRGELVSGYFTEHLLADSIPRIHNAREAGAARSRLKGLRQEAASLGPAHGARAVFDLAAGPLAAFLGFDVKSVEVERQTRAAGVRPSAGSEAPRLLAVLEHRSALVPMSVVPWGEPLDSSWRPAVLAAIDASARWCLVFNGTNLRILDSWRSYSREHLEFDLDLVASDDHAFRAFWTLARADAFTSSAGGSCVLERAISLSARHTTGVCRSLTTGVLEALGALMQGFLDGGGGRDGIDTLFEQSLTLVYRLLFLLFAEARRLLPTWHTVFAEGYSVEALRSVAEDPRAHAHVGLWETFQAMSRLAHRGCRAGGLVVTPFNGRLFSPARTPLGEREGVADAVARRAVVALSTTPASRSGAGRHRIAYRDLGVEQLGAVYESILDYQPTVQPGSGRRPVVTLAPGSGARKATGSFYTPRSITRYLVRRTLHPLLSPATSEEILALRVVDPAMGSGAFLVAACHHMAAAYERALVAEGGCHASDIDERDRAGFRRLIAQRCLFGVDANPMAVQLARLSLWLATLAADRPLTFLDHHLVSGDSLVGASPFDVLRAPSRRSPRRGGGRDQPMLFDPEELVHDVERVLPDRLRVASEPADTVEAVQDKERTIEALNRPDGPFARWKQAGDLWCASWFGDRRAMPSRGVYHELLGASIGGQERKPPWLTARLDGARQLASAHRFFHWQLEFPEAFFGTAGGMLDNPGFDAVIGNPPWDMLRADDSSRHDRDYDRSLLDYVRHSGVYAAQSDGHPNRFQLFVERSLQLVRRDGRLGLVVPWGIFADHGCAALRRQVFLGANTDTIVAFDNSKAVFPIHRSLRFALVTATAGGRTDRTSCRLGEVNASVLDGLPDALVPADYPIVLSPGLLLRLSGSDLSVPNVRTPADLAILDAIASRWPSVSAAAGWGAKFGRELNASDDRPHFTPAVPSGRAEQLPVVEGKHLSPFVAHLDDVRYCIPWDVARRLPGHRALGRWRLAYRDVASATNRVTLIAAMLPPGCASTHTVFCLKTALDETAQWFLCGILNSYVANYLVRLRVTTHVSAGIVERLPVPFVSPVQGSGGEVARLARRLAADSDDNTEPRLQALVAKLYGVTEGEFEHVLSTFPLVERERRDAALREFQLDETTPGR